MEKREVEKVLVLQICWEINTFLSHRAPPTHNDEFVAFYSMLHEEIYVLFHAARCGIFSNPLCSIESTASSVCCTPVGCVKITRKAQLLKRLFKNSRISTHFEVNAWFNCKYVTFNALSFADHSCVLFFCHYLCSTTNQNNSKQCYSFWMLLNFDLILLFTFFFFLISFLVVFFV